MISLSKLIKSAHALHHEENKKSIALQTIDIISPTDEIQEPGLSSKAKILIQKANQEADGIIQSAKAEAEQIRRSIFEEQQAWLTEREMQKEEARQEGFLTGLDAGKEEGLKQYSAGLLEARAIVAQSKEDYIEKVVSSEETVVKLAVKLAEKLIFIQLEEHPEWFLELVQKALREVREYPDIKIFVHPIHYPHLLNHKNELENVLMSKTDLYIFPDESLPEGSCQIESPFGKMDAGIDTQLQQLKLQMLELVREE